MATRALEEREVLGEIERECLAANLEAARLTSPAVRAAGVCLNTSALPADEARRLCAETEASLNLPCTDPIAFGVEAVVDRLLCPAA